MVSWKNGRSQAILFALLLGSLAGCVDEPGTADTNGSGLSKDVQIDTTDPNAPLGAPNQVPEWEYGDYWTFRNANGDILTFVVTSATAQDYYIDTTSDAFAFANALSGVSTVGPQRVKDLAGSQGSDRIEFFHWPLVDGETWTTTWDQSTKTIVATAEANGVFSYVATDEDDSLYATYTYDPAAKWFGELAFFFGGTNPVFSNTLIESGAGWTGEVLRYEVEEVFSDSSAMPGAAPADVKTVQFTQSATHTDVYVSYRASCAAGIFFFTTVPGEPTAETSGYSANDPCPKADNFQASAGNQPGDWGITLARAADADATWSILVLLRTLELVPVA